MAGSGGSGSGEGAATPAARLLAAWEARRGSPSLLPEAIERLLGEGVADEALRAAPALAGADGPALVEAVRRAAARHAVPGRPDLVAELVAVPIFGPPREVRRLALHPVAVMGVGRLLADPPVGAASAVLVVAEADPVAAADALPSTLRALARALAPSLGEGDASIPDPRDIAAAVPGARFLRAGPPEAEPEAGMACGFLFGAVAMPADGPLLSRPGTREGAEQAARWVERASAIAEEAGVGCGFGLAGCWEDGLFAAALHRVWGDLALEAASLRPEPPAGEADSIHVSRADAAGVFLVAEVRGDAVLGPVPVEARLLATRGDEFLRALASRARRIAVHDDAATVPGRAGAPLH